MVRSFSAEELNEIASFIIGGAIAVHKQMSPGLLESVYQQCMIKELRLRNLKVACKVPLSLQYKGEPIDKDYFLDLLIEDAIILELKAVDGILPVHEAQLLTYLRLSNLKLAFLINFNVVMMKDGIRRLVNKF